MNEKQEILEAMFRLGISYPELSQGTHIVQHKLYYILNHSSKSLPIDVYTRIMKYLEHRGHFTEDHIGSPSELIPAAFHLNSLVNEFMGRMNHSIQDVCADGVISVDERLTLKAKLSAMKTKLSEQIDNMLERI